MLTHSFTPRHDDLDVRSSINYNCSAREALSVDAGYAGYPVLVTSRKQNYRLNLKTRGKERDEKLNDPQHQARRWIVERTQSWLKPLPQTPGQLRKTEASFTAAYQDAAERAASIVRGLCGQPKLPAQLL